MRRLPLRLLRLRGLVRPLQPRPRSKRRSARPLLDRYPRQLQSLQPDLFIIHFLTRGRWVSLLQPTYPAMSNNVSTRSQHISENFSFKISANAWSYNKSTRTPWNVQRKITYFSWTSAFCKSKILEIKVGICTEIVQNKHRENIFSIALNFEPDNCEDLERDWKYCFGRRVWCPYNRARTFRSSGYL